jgi:hypothetical protein
VSATTTSLIICALLIGGALSGVLLRRLLPDYHLDAHAKDIVRLGCALIAALSPTTEGQRAIQSQAVELANTILQTRLILHEQSSTRMPLPFLVVLVFWLSILFASFCLFSPLNPTAFAAVTVIALSASGAIFLILELYRPFSGLMQIESEPLRQALAPLAP